MGGKTVTFTARYPGKCPCGNGFREGDSVGWIDGEVCCTRCVENGEVYEPPAAPTCPDCLRRSAEALARNRIPATHRPGPLPRLRMAHPNTRTHQRMPTKGPNTVTDNRFADCTTVNDVLWRYHECARDGETEYGPPALARIAELSPRTVDAAGREMAVAMLDASRWLWSESTPQLVDRIIDALGWTAVEPEPHRCADVADDCCERTPAPASSAGNRFANCETVELLLSEYVTVANRLGTISESLGARREAAERIRYLLTFSEAPASPAVEPDWHVDFAPDELLTLAKIVDDFERLYNDVAQVVAQDTMRTTLDLDIIDGGLPVRVVCNDHGCWVLRIGGDQ